MRSGFINNEILVYLSDNKIHTAIEIAEKLEIGVCTVYRHINELTVTYPISSFRGGNKKGYLLSENIKPLFSLWEIDYLLQIIPTDTNIDKIKLLIQKLQLLKRKGESEENDK